MTRPTAAPAHWPYFEHRTCEEVEREHVEAAVNGASTISWNRREMIRQIAERRAAERNHHRSTSPRCEPAAVSKPPAAGEFPAVSR